MRWLLGTLLLLVIVSQRSATTISRTTLTVSPIETHVQRVWLECRWVVREIIRVGCRHLTWTWYSIAARPHTQTQRLLPGCAREKVVGIPSRASQCVSAHPNSYKNNGGKRGWNFELASQLMIAISFVETMEGWWFVNQRQVFWLVTFNRAQWVGLGEFSSTGILFVIWSRSKPFTQERSNYANTKIKTKVRTSSVRETLN